MRAALLLLLAGGGASALDVTTHRPDSSTWKRTQCGSPSGKHGPIPAVPAQPAKPAGPAWTPQDKMDCGGADMPPCGPNGCVLNKTATMADCEAQCKALKGCAAAVFAEASCSGPKGPICWSKSACHPKKVSNCRAVSEAKGSPPVPAKPAVPAQPAGPGADIPSKYGLGVSASTTPLVKFPRPQMVRGTGATETLRDTGDPKVWTNLNGLWEWEAAAATDASAPPFGKTLSGSILVSSFRPSSATYKRPQRIQSDLLAAFRFRGASDTALRKPEIHRVDPEFGSTLKLL
jgi:hypothetical protein